MKLGAYVSPESNTQSRLTNVFPLQQKNTLFIVIHIIVMDYLKQIFVAGLTYFCARLQKVIAVLHFLPCYGEVKKKGLVLTVYVCSIEAHKLSNRF